MGRRFVVCLFVFCCLARESVAAQPADTPAPAAPAPDTAPDAPQELQTPPAADSPSDAGTPEAAPAPDAETPPEAAPEAAPEQEAPSIEAPERGDTPVSFESVVNPDAVAEPPPSKPEPTEPPPTKPAPTGEPPHKPTKPTQPEPSPTPAPLIAWAAADWASSLGPARCGARGLEGADLAIKIASTLKQSAAAAGLGVAPSGALADHPLIAYAAKEQPQLLADLLAESGFSAIVVGVADINGPLLREPRLSEALQRRGITVVASNLECKGQAFCQSWVTAEDPQPILERDGRRYALIGVLPDDLLARTEPAAGRSFELQPVVDTLVARTEEARTAGAELIVASIDHGPDGTASSNVANFLSELPPDVRPDLLLSPSTANNLLFLRPLDVQPAVVGTRGGVLTGLRVSKVPDTNDSDVFARSVRLSDADSDLSERVQKLGAAYCHARGKALPGGDLKAPMDHGELVELAAGAVRAVAGADLAVVDPLVYSSDFAQPGPTHLQRGQMEGAVVLDSPLVAASVSLDWLGALNKVLDGLRPLVLIGNDNDDGVALIAGRIPVVGAKYYIVTSAVLARSGRLPDGADWSPIEGPDATLRGALLSHLDEPAPEDPRSRLRDPTLSTQWVLRADGQVQANLTAVDNPTTMADPAALVYEDPALQVQDSRQLGARLIVNLDADAPGFLFENLVQVGFDRNFATKTTAQDLIIAQSTYTYRGLWPRPLGYPHPFAEGYLETQFDKGEAAYRHLMIRPKAGLRSLISRVLSLKVFAGFQYEVFEPGSSVYPGVGAELLLKPWTVALEKGTLQMEGNLIYYWNSPGNADEHILRGQLISAIQLIGPLQFTLTALAVVQKEPDFSYGKGVAIQAGVRLRFVDRTMSD